MRIVTVLFFLVVPAISQSCSLIPFEDQTKKDEIDKLNDVGGGSAVELPGEKNDADSSDESEADLSVFGLRYGEDGSGILLLSNESGEKHYVQTISEDGDRGETKIVKEAEQFSTFLSKPANLIKIRSEKQAAVFIAKTFVSPDDEDDQTTYVMTYADKTGWGKMEPLEIDRHARAAAEYDASGDLVVVWGHTLFSEDQDRGLWWSALNRQGKLSKPEKLNDDTSNQTFFALGSSPQGNVAAVWCQPIPIGSGGDGFQIIMADYSDDGFGESVIVADALPQRIKEMQISVSSAGAATILWELSDYRVMASYREDFADTWSTAKEIFSPKQKISSVAFEFSFGIGKFGIVHLRAYDVGSYVGEYVGAFNFDGDFSAVENVSQPQKGGILDFFPSSKGKVVGLYSKGAVEDNIYIGVLKNNKLSNQKTISSNFYTNASAINPIDGSISIAGQPTDSRKIEIEKFDP